MKKYVSLGLAALLIAALCTVPGVLAADVTYLPSDVAEYGGTVKVASDAITAWQMDGYVAFRDVDMTNVQSVRMHGATSFASSRNGEIFCLRLDSAKGEILGWVKFNEEGERDFVGAIEQPVSGRHSVYIVSTFDHAGYTKVTSVTFSTEPAIDDVYIPVPDSAIIDNYHDTWVAVDGMGRAVADFSEAGEVQNEDKYIGMFYWNWHSPSTTAVPTNPWRIVAAHPESKYDYNNPVWSASGRYYYWDEPIFGYYDNRDYWVYRKQAVLLANADVDVVFFDYTNGDPSWYGGLKVQLDAWRDARSSGVDAPKISALCSWKTNKANSVKFLYLTMFREGKYSDLWFYWDGKPLLMSGAASGSERYPNKDDAVECAFLDEMYDFFTFRTSGGRSGQTAPNQFVWLEDYPQHPFGTYKDGRVEFMSLGCAINESYVWGGGITGVFSDEYTKGRSYTEAFGEDWREGSFRQNYFLKEQESRVLDIDPAFVFVDGWNEWIAGRQALYSGVENCFVDTYDNEGSRDIEPSRGPLGDDTYMMFVDFVRKYRGVRPAPLASAEKTVDLAGDISQWDDVSPAFINDFDDYERDAYAYRDPETGGSLHHTTKINNAIARAKVARDSENFYFYIQTTRDIVTGTNDWMNLYINTDRNYATGFSGYDFAINRSGAGTVEKNVGGLWQWETVGKARYTVSGNVLQIAVPRALLGEDGTVDFEFKVTDGVCLDGDILKLYQDGSVAPMGRFNYLYTEIAQTTANASQRERLFGTTVFKKGANRMMAWGGKMYVYEKDTRVTTFEQDGTLYIPVGAMEDVLGFGTSKFVYDSYENVLHLEAHDLDENDKISHYRWTYTTLGSYEARINGRLVTLSHPVIASEGIVYVPLSYLAECFDCEIYDSGDGFIASGLYGVDTYAVNDVKNLL